MNRGGRGERGRDGATGAEGRAGTTGASGSPGGVGATGPTGPQGRPGRNAAAGFLILMTFCFMGFVRVDQQTEKLDQQADQIQALARKSVFAAREGCRRLNVIRENQGQALEEEIEQSERSLRGKLGALESFRTQVEEGLAKRKAQRQSLWDSVKDLPVPKKPYWTDCVRAYP